MTATPRAVVVLGPGRSGTSALTRAVATLGVDLGSNLKQGTSKNARGFFEDLDIDAELMEHVLARAWRGTVGPE